MSHDSTSNSGKSRFELFIELLKAIVWPLVVVSLVTCHNSPVFRFMAGMPDVARDLSIKEATTKIGPGGIEMSFKRAAHEEAKKIVYERDTAASKSVATANMAEANRVPKEIIPDVKVLEATAPQEVVHSWVYIGQRVGNTWLSKNFDVVDVPTPNAVLKANTAVYKRDADPQPLPNVDWKLGKVVGVVEGGKIVYSVRVKEITGGNWWAEVIDRKP